MSVWAPLDVNRLFLKVPRSGRKQTLAALIKDESWLIQLIFSLLMKIKLAVSGISFCHPRIDEPPLKEEALSLDLNGPK